MALNECLTFANDKKMSSMSRVTCLIMIRINSKSKVAVMTKNRKVAVMTKKMALYCPQDSGTLRQQLLKMHGIAW